MAGIFSDHHRGARNGADDFQRSERAYNTALAYYFAMGYKLVVLGDVEELWEEKHKHVLESYAHTLELERKFHEAGRYYRSFGNHDDDWGEETAVAKHLQPRFGNKPLKIYEAFCIPVESNEGKLGRLFLIHGHQGTLESDRYSGFSRWWVRNAWRPFQRLTKIRLTTPAKDWRLRNTHNLVMYDWAKKQGDLVLITGHTHNPVFESKTHAEQLMEKQLAVANDPKLSDIQKQEKLADLAAKLEWVRAQQNQEHKIKEQQIRRDVQPCYFNTGCCSFSDGDITGLEIADDKIRLVRWPNDKGEARSKELAEASLKDIFTNFPPA